jgi:hypothetical protein
MRMCLLVLLCAAAAACGRDAAPAAGAPAVAVPGAPAGPFGAEPGSADWPESGQAVNLRRERALDFTGDGAVEVVQVTARGEEHDSLEITLVIRNAAGDTLWRDGWPSLHYFKYDRVEGKSAEEVRQIVRSHVDSLLADDRFSQRGLPPRLRRGGDSRAMMQEAVQYHLAELDWRGRADLRPADPTPGEAYSRIEPQHVVRERVNVVLQELEARPVFWYYAGGEAVYAIAWSERENAFVRLYSCC